MTQKLSDFQQDVKVLNVEIESLNSKINSQEVVSKDKELELQELKELLFNKKVDQDREFRIKEKLEIGLKNATDNISKKDVDLSAKANEIRALKDFITKLESQVKEEKVKVEMEVQERGVVKDQIISITSELNDQILANAKLQKKNEDQETELKNWEEELKRFKEEYRIMNRMKDALNKKIKALDEGKMEAEVERDSLRVSLFVF